MRLKLIAFIGGGLLLLCLALLLALPGHPAAADAGSPRAALAAPAGLSRLQDTATPPATVRAFLPAVMGPLPPTPTPTATPTPTPTPTQTATPSPTPSPTPSAVLNPKCYWFELGPSDRDDVECSATNGLVIRRYNISFSMVACCGTNGAKHYAVTVDAAKVAGEGDYRIGFDVRSLTQGGGYLFGVNADTRTYSLIRIDDGNWKGGVPIIDWTFSDTILPGAGVNRMEVERHGATILLRINGQQVAAVPETTWLDQGIGWTLYARNYQGPGLEVHFENMRYVQWNDVP